MFGSLITDQQNELLTFVDTDPAAALCRSRRSKPHVSCGFCRTRKIKCSGEPTGCERCIAAGIECKYPPRESRRKKSSQIIYSRDSATNSSAGSEASGLKEGDRTKIATDDISRRQSPFHMNRCEQSPLRSDKDLDMIDLISDINSEPFNIDNTIPPRSVGDIGHLDIWECNEDFSGAASPMAFSGYNDNEITFGNVDKALEAMLAKANATTRGRSPASASLYTESPSLIASEDLVRRSRAGTTSTQTGSQPSVVVDDHVLPGLMPSKTAAIRKQQSPDGCDCLHLTARFLESLGAKSGSNGVDSLDSLLGYLREALTKFSAFLDCKMCSSATANIMLVAMAGRYISMLYERLVRSYTRILRDYVNFPIQESGGEGVCFLSYRIEDAYEQVQVLRCLVSIQLTQFWQLLGKLKARPGTFNGHLELLAEAEKRVQDAGTMLKAAIDRY
ncbi:hypothetical protein F5Y04DRAFT_288710 [Hypomontagnella monticulosa]|nr:hypothetical protein F5Y04DRAFT_288710 [Hypomontagnella monticulosa]